MLLIVGGFLDFLPILEFWMVPLGILLISSSRPPRDLPVADHSRHSHQRPIAEMGRVTAACQV